MRQHLKRAGRAGWRFLASFLSRPARRRVVPSIRPDVELLERRDTPAVSSPTYVLFHPSGLGPLSTSGPTGTTPSQIRHAYGFDRIAFDGGSVAGDGSGETIAIVDAYDDPNIAHDLHQFDQAFGLPDPNFKKVNQNGGSTMPAPNGGWIGEIALDVEWAHAIAPGANILLVEANSNSDSDLFTAVQYAAGVQGVVVVSMSWGSGEFGGETSYDSTFTTPNGHAGVTFVASSGDTGAPPIYPSVSPNVIATGGTTLNVDGAGNIQSESAWSGSGGGISSFESQPSYQRGVVPQTSSARTTPDVAYDADPNTGFPVYDSYNNGTDYPWVQYGGTSDAAPQWAGLIAIADQGLALAGYNSLDGPSQTLPALYHLSARDFHDITSGSSGGTPNYSAGRGYDLATGRGTPVANLVVSGLVTAGTPRDWSKWTKTGTTAGAVAAGGNADGSQQEFTLGLHGGLWVRTQPAGGSWGSWSSLGGSSLALAVTTNAQGFQDVFVIGQDHGLRTLSETALGQWSAWTNLGGWVSSIAAGTTATGTEQVFGINSKNALTTRTEIAAGTWTSWTSLGGVGWAPVVTVNSAGLLDAFVLGTDNAVWTRSETAPGVWTNWTSLGGSWSAFSAGTNSDGTEQVFGVGAGGAISVLSQSAPGTWSTSWTSLGGNGQAVLVGRNSQGLLDVFVVGGAGAIWTRTQTAAGTFSNWTSLGGGSTSIAVTTDSSGDLELLTSAPGDGTVWLRQQTSPGVWS